MRNQYLLVLKTLTGQLHSQTIHVNTQILTIGKNRIIFSTGLSAISKTKYLQWKQLLWVHNNTELLPPVHIQLNQPHYNTQTCRRKPAPPSWLHFLVWAPELLQSSNLWSCPDEEGSEEPSPTYPDKITSESGRNSQVPCYRWLNFVWKHPTMYSHAPH